MKKWYKSRTLIFNALCAGLFALEASMELFKPLVGDKFYPLLAGGLLTVNAMLRTVTTEPITESKTNDKTDTSDP